MHKRSPQQGGRLGSVDGHGVDAAEAPRACAAPGIVLTHRAGAAGFLGYVRRRATELPAKKCCRGTSDLPRGQPNNLFSKSWFDPAGAAKSWFIPPQVLVSTCTQRVKGLEGLCIHMIHRARISLEAKLETSDRKPRSQTPTTSKPIARRWQAEDVSGRRAIRQVSLAQRPAHPAVDEARSQDALPVGRRRISLPGRGGLLLDGVVSRRPRRPIGGPLLTETTARPVG